MGAMIERVKKTPRTRPGRPLERLATQADNSHGPEEMEHDERRDIEARAAWQGVSAAFAALGRTFVCVDREFRVIHASTAIDEMLGEGASEGVAGKRVSDLLGTDLFGPAGTLTLALRGGEKKEGWRAHLRLDDGEHHLVSLSAAPFPTQMMAACDPRVAYVLVLRPSEEDTTTEALGPTSISGLIARSPAMLRIFALIDNLRHSDATVLITGESGTGKELVARSIHEHSPRTQGPFVAVNCGALPGELLESELFGHVRGAFTGAVKDRVGRFEMASDGTLFLDEVGDLPLPLQVKLLRVLQERTFERLGESTRGRARAASSPRPTVDLRRPVADGRFREDLYYRLRVVPIEIPPLRARREDIEPLARCHPGPGRRAQGSCAAALAGCPPGAAPTRLAGQRPRAGERARVRRRRLPWSNAPARGPPGARQGAPTVRARPRAVPCGDSSARHPPARRSLRRKPNPPRAAGEPSGDRRAAPDSRPAPVEPRGHRQGPGHQPHNALAAPQGSRPDLDAPAPPPIGWEFSHPILILLKRACAITLQHHVEP